MKKIRYYCEENDHYTHGVDSGMLAYLQEFRPDELKYSVFADKIFYDGKAPHELTHPAYKNTLPLNIIEDIRRYDSVFRMSELTKEDYSFIKENLMLVYGDSKVVNNDIKAYHYTEKKIIHEYLAIPQLDKMFDEDYFNFEWDMHVGRNLNEHRYDYYRDHFIHQIRDMYSILILLGRYGFFESIYDTLFDKAMKAKIPQFTNLKLEEFLHKKQDAYIITDKIYDSVKAEAERLLRNLKSGDNNKERIKQRIKSKDAYAEAYFKKYVIYASAILATLFHDMGYPICHFLEVRHRISDYSPTMHMFTHNVIDSFDTVVSKLGGSLLFTIVSTKEIKKALEVNSGGRFDHGAYSAIAFLMQFYNNGLIFSLPTEKQCAIELAAVAIYNHTRKYIVMKPDVHSNYFQPVFVQNPISFLLRLCDDLQEWGRRYFEISTESDLLICSNCYVPSLSKTADGSKQYFCACNHKTSQSEYANSLKNSGFLKRKLYLVTTSDQMISEILPTAEDKNQKILYFRIDYNLFRLLNIARINSTYASFRIKELNGIKKLLMYQNFQTKKDSWLEFKYIYIDYFMTSNPILIKVKILEKYLLAKELQGDRDRYTIPYADLKKLVMNLDAASLINDLKIPFDSFLGKIVSQSSKGMLFDFYKRMLDICIDVRCNRRSDQTKLNTIIEDYASDSIRNTMYCDTIKGLIYDCYQQYFKETVINSDGSISSDFIKKGSMYYKQYQSNDDSGEALLADCVNTYCCMENEFNRYDNFDANYDNPYIGYFADLHMFELMNEEIQKEYQQRL